jgi:hypothetical protein
MLYKFCERSHNIINPERSQAGARGFTSADISPEFLTSLSFYLVILTIRTIRQAFMIKVAPSVILPYQKTF